MKTAIAFLIFLASCTHRIRVATVYRDGTTITTHIGKDSLRIRPDTTAHYILITRSGKKG